jgi:ferric-dicitrate binding protein FerR (iron transport regulator)
MEASKAAWREKSEPGILHLQQRSHPARPHLEESCPRSRRRQSEQPAMVMVLAPMLGLALWAGILSLILRVF